MYSIGLDIAKSSIAVHIPTHSLDFEIENNLKSLKTLYAKLKKLYRKEIDKVVWVFESTGSYSSIIYRFCSQKGIKIFMPNPKQARGFAKAIAQRNKSDKIDAQVLAKSIIIAKKDEIKIPSINPLVEEFKELIGYYRLLVKQISQLKNHKESLVAKEANKRLINAIIRQIKMLQTQQQTLIDTMLQTIKEDNELSNKFHAIVSIKGVGTLTALVLLHLFIRYPDANQRQIVSLAGLDPIIKESGSSIKGKVKISKAGDKIYRASLFMPAMVVVRHDERFKAYYERLKASGKHTTVAQVAVMRKLLIVAHSIYKSGEVYRG
jgi:transposase